MLIAEANMALDYKVLKMSRFRPPMDVGRVSSKLQFSKFWRPEKSFPGQGDPRIHSQCWAWGDVYWADPPEVHGQVAVGSNPSQYEICFCGNVQTINQLKKEMNQLFSEEKNGSTHTNQSSSQASQDIHEVCREKVFPIWKRLMWLKEHKVSCRCWLPSPAGAKP